MRLAARHRHPAPVRTCPGSRQASSPATAIANRACALDSGVRATGRRRSGVALRPDAGQGDRLGADPARGGPAAGRRAGPGPDPRRGHQPRPAGPGAAAPGVPRRRDRHRVLRPAPGGARAAAVLGGRAAVGLAAALAGAAGRARGCCGLPSGWRNVPSAAAAERYRAGTATLEVGYRLDPGRAESSTGDVALVDADAGSASVLGDRRAYARTVRGRGVRRRLVCVDSSLGLGGADAGAPLPRPARQVAAGSLLAPMPGVVTRVGVRSGEVDAGTAAAVAGGDEDGTPHRRPGRRGGHRTAVEAGRQVEVGAVLAVVRRRKSMNFIESAERQALRDAVAELGKRYGHEWFNQGADRRAHHRAVGRGRQARLPRRQPARGVRRRRRRHHRPGDRARGAGRRRLPAAADGRLAGDLRHRDRPLRHRRAEAALAARPRRRAPRSWPSRSPSPTPARTSTSSPRPPADERRLVAHRPQGLHLRRGRRRGGAGRRPHRGRADREAEAGAVHRAGRRARASSSTRSRWT